MNYIPEKKIPTITFRACLLLVVILLTSQYPKLTGAAPRRTKNTNPVRPPRTRVNKLKSKPKYTNIVPIKADTLLCTQAGEDLLSRLRFVMTQVYLMLGTYSIT
jgi:hypothetical protein